MFSTVNVYDGPQFGANVVGSYAYTDAALINIINFHTGSRRLSWRFDLCTSTRGSDGAPSFKADLTPWVSRFTVTCDSTRAVARSLDLTMVETAASQTVTIGGTTVPVAGSTGTGFFGPGLILDVGVNYLSDLVRPVALIGVPGTSNWIHCPLMVGRFTRPAVSVPGYAVLRTATLPDLTSLVQESSAIDPVNVNGVSFTLPATYKVMDCIVAMLKNPPTNVQDITSPATEFATIPGCGLASMMPSNISGAPGANTPGDWPTSTVITATMASDYTVPEGTSYLDTINHLLKCVNCFPLMCDERGILRVQQMPATKFAPFPNVPVPDYQSTDAAFSYQTAVKWTYDTTTDSIVTFGLDESINIDDIANIVQVKVEDGSRTPYLATAINADPASPYNVTNWAGTGQSRRIVKIVDEGQVPDIDPTNATNYAQGYAARELLQASWLTDQVDMPIAVNPLHCGYWDHDLIRLNIWQKFVAAGSPANLPVITGTYAGSATVDPGLNLTQLFLMDGWTITGTLQNPGGGSNLTGNAGLTTDLSPRETKQGSTMVIKCHRVTKTLAPSGITFLP